MEGTAVQGEPQPAGKPRARLHRVVLCCAGSVRGMVEEVARNMAGLGFDTEVVCGAEARAALLGRPANHTGRPTIYVLCVQGSLKETVLKPLRQALATHAGPHEHLFVGVLDLSLPLAMVGQIRRFADELERQAGSPAGRDEQLAAVERREWREQVGDRGFDRIQTRSYRALQVVRRDASKGRARRAGFEPGELSSATAPASQAIVAGRRPAKIAPTQKYRAVTGSLPALPRAGSSPEPVGEAESESVAAPSDSTNASVPKATTADVPSSPDAPPVSASAVEQPPEDSRPAIRHAPSESGQSKRSDPLVHGLQDAEPNRGRGALIGLLAVAGLTGAVWVSGGLPTIERQLLGDASESAPTRQPTAAVSATVPTETETAKPAEPTKASPSETDASRSSAAPTPLEAAVRPRVPPAPETERSDEASGASSSGAPSNEALPAHQVAAQERTLREARVQYELRESRDFWITLALPPTTDWQTAVDRCASHTFRGIGGWRLPWRRELKLLGAIERLNEGQFWSRSPGEDDDDFAYVYDADQRELVRWLKAEPTGGVVCIRDKQR